MRRLGAVGTLVWDRIDNPHAPEPVRREQWGGAVYSFASLSAACPAGWSVEPIVKIGHDLWERGCELLGELPNISPGAGVVRVPERNNHVHLHYHDLEHRTELQTGGVPGWTWEELEPLLDGIDALYINFLSGVEMDLDTARRLRARFDGPIYADLHSLFLGPASRSARKPRLLPRWQEWLACFDGIQLNEDEMALLGRGAGEYRSPECFEADLPRFGPGLVMITEGGEGVRYVVADGMPTDPLEWPLAVRGEGSRRGAVPAPQGRLPGDPTGCGDVWGAGFLCGLLDGLGLEEAIARAERMAAAKILHPETACLSERLREVVSVPA